MLRFSALVAVSALMLAACSQSGNSQPSTSSSQTSTQKTTARRILPAAAWVKAIKSMVKVKTIFICVKSMWL